MVSNSNRKASIASFITALIFTIMIFAPGFLGIDGFSGGFAMSLVSILIAITAAFVGLMYWRWANELDNILKGKDILAHWIYSDDYWQTYTKKEYVTEKSEKKGLFLIVTAFALFFGFLFLALDNEGGSYVLLIMLFLIGLTGFAWRFSAWNNYRQNLHGTKEAYITSNAVYINKKFSTWKAPFTHFDKVVIEKNQGINVLSFHYTIMNRTGPTPYTTRVPIPIGEENTAESIVQTLNN